MSALGVLQKARSRGLIRSSAETSSAGLILQSLAIVALLQLALLFFFEPTWETNDDVGMSMVAHGYGMAAYGSPHLIFSSSIWGTIVRAIPPINGVLGYSTATLFSVYVAGAASLYFLQRLGVRLVVAVFAVSALIVRPVVAPQFTLNSGLLTVAAILGLWAFARTHDKWALVASITLGFLGYLIRSQELILVAGIALPLLPWREILRNRTLHVGLAAVVILVAVASMVDFLSFRGPEWARFMAFNGVRLPLTDYGAATILIDRPDLLARYNFTVNDVLLIARWFFVDPKVANPTAVAEMISALGPRPLWDGYLALGPKAIESLTVPRMWPLLVAGLLLLIVRPRWPLLLSWVIFLVAVYVMGLWGRGGILRVITPLLYLLFVAGLVNAYKASGDRGPSRWLSDSRRRDIALCVCVAVGVIEILMVAPSTIGLRRISPGEQVSPRMMRIQQAQTAWRERVQGGADELLVSWGSAMPMQSLFPVLAREPGIMDIRFYHLGTITFAPYSVSAVEEANGRGFTARILSPEGVLIQPSTTELKLLGVWCEERHGGELKLEGSRETPIGIVRRVWCQTDT